jgi:predicted HTH transcriptional regulator
MSSLLFTPDKFHLSLFDDDFFKFSEGNHLEFKQFISRPDMLGINYSDLNLKKRKKNGYDIDLSYNKKIQETICAFLNNTYGGYIIFGIDDKTLRLIGLINDFKDFDNFILQIDSIITNSIIISQYTTATGEEIVQRVSPTCIGTEKIINTRGQIFMIIKITPEQGKKYQFRSGHTIHRLNASNMYVVCEKYITENEAKFKLYQSMNEIKSNMKKTISCYKHEIDKLQKMLLLKDTKNM